MFRTTLLQDDMLSFMLQSKRYSAKKRGQLSPADFNVKDDVAVTRKPRGRASIEQVQDSAGNAKTVYSSITKANEEVILLWGDEGKLHFGDSKNIKAQLLNPTLATRDPTRWHLEAAPRPVLKPKPVKTNIQASKSNETTKKRRWTSSDLLA